jgi:hypothetical protein
MTSTTEEANNTQPTATSQTPPKKPRGGAPRAKVARPPTRAARKSTHSKKVAKGRTKTVSARKGSKTATILNLLRRTGGATLKELKKATGWQPHSVRGFLSGVVGKKMGLKLAYVSDDSGERRYTVKA